MNEDAVTHRSGLARAAAYLICLWALAGGVVLLAVVAVNVLSVFGAVFWRPFPGDFELTEMGVAVAAFAFLPYVQLTGSNVTADIFTARAGPRALAWFGLLASTTALLFSLVLLWRMYLGMVDQRAYSYTTAILQVPIWWAYLLVIISIGLLAVASLLTLTDDARGAVGRR